MSDNIPIIGATKAPDPKKVTIRAECCDVCKSGCFEADRIESGECRREPPKMQFVPSVNRVGQQVLQTVAAWPTVRRDQWCVTGFEPRETH